ncbi:MAG: adenosylmethionine decarboxylase [Myxococcales bacterium]|nr:adenosylmethionine decarboxylase [Myxococcales bacterium]
METRGQHLLAEYYGCPSAVLNDEGAIRALLQRAAQVAGATVVATVFHRFAPQGVSGVVVVEESHLSIHTWPEAGYAAVDFYTCGECFPERAHEVLMEGLEPDQSEFLRIDRGLSRNNSIQVGRHARFGMLARAAGHEPR